MTSDGYKDWLAAGRPYTLIRPAKAVQATLRRHGLTVYDYPDTGHLTATVPQDHTPFSATGWPGANRRWNARGLDIMPRSDSAAGRKENADIARQFIRDRDAGVPGVMWIKYLNWTDEKGACRQERWTDKANPNRRTTISSNDKGHIHISGRSDADSDTRADTYDPIARMNGVSPMATAAEYAAHNADAALYALNKRQDSYKAVPAPAPAPPAGVTALTVPNVMKEIEQTINETKAAVLAIQAGQPSDEQWALLLALIERLFAEKVGEAAELGAAAALARTRLTVDAPPAA